MHVLIAAHDLYPDAGSGGSGRYIYETARRLAARDHQVSVVTRRRGAEPARETLDGIDVYRYDITVAGEAAPSIAVQLPRVRRKIRDEVAALSSPTRPDLVSFHGPVTSLLVDREIPDAVPRVTTFHSPWSIEYAIKTAGDSDRSALRRQLNVAVRRRLEGRVLACSDGAVALSDYMRDWLRRIHGETMGVSVIPGGVDAEQFAPDSNASGPDALIPNGDGPAFLTVRRLSRRMGHDRLLAAFASVLDDQPDARLYVAGDGPLREPLERLANELGVAERTTFLGYVPDTSLPATYAAADVFVLPTRELEGFGLATLEALASGTPVVATPVGGTVEVLAGLRDQLPADPLTTGPGAAAIADGMNAWAALDDETREAAGSACRQYVRDHYSWERTVDRLVDDYDRYLR